MLSRSAPIFELPRLACVAGRALIDFRTPETRQDQGSAPGHKMGAVQFGRDMCSETTASQRLGGQFRIRRGRQKVSAQRQEDLDLSAMHRLDAFHRVAAMVPGRVEAVPVC